MSITERLIGWFKKRRIRQKEVEDDATLLMRLFGDGAYGEAGRRALDQVEGDNSHGRPKRHWAAVKDVISRLERIY